MAGSATPLVDEFIAGMDPSTAEVLGAIDAERLDRERAELAPWAAEKATSASDGVWYQLRAWERLSHRLSVIDPSSSNPYFSYYMIEEFLNDLRIRDDLGALVTSLPEPTRSHADALLGAIDEKFKRITVDDGGKAVQDYYVNGFPGIENRPWYWQRRPIRIPWDDL